MPGISFPPEVITEQARRMGLLNADGTLPARHRSAVIRALAETEDAPEPEPPAPEPARPQTLTVTVEITLGDRVVGATVTHVSLPEGPTAQ